MRMPKKLRSNSSILKSNEEDDLVLFYYKDMQPAGPVERDADNS